MKAFFSSARALMVSAVFGVGLMAGAANAADLTLNISDTVFDPIPAGGTIEYEVRIDNGGNVRTDADKIEFTIPAGATYTGTTGALTSCTPAPPANGPIAITCDVPSMAPRERIESTVEIVPGVIEGGVLTFGASITGAKIENTEDTTVLLGADLALSFDAPSEIQGGDILSFKALLTNNGPYPSQGVEFSMPLPAALSGELVLPQGCSIAAHEVSCTIASEIAVGETLEMEFAISE